METDLFFFLLLLFFVLVLSFDLTTAQIPGFISFDCGGQSNFTDNLGLDWTPDSQIIYGITTNISVTNETRQQYQTVRYFPADNRKYCYTLDVKSRTRYLIRATFLYAISITITCTRSSTFPWDPLVGLRSVCLSNATTGQPFISTLELRPFNGSIYLTPFENQFFLGVSARINFGAENEDPIRYPDDPFDRIWESDLVKKANYLVDVAAGTDRISTNLPIDTRKDEQPPEKVMQTAVVGRNGTLTYRMNLDGFPGYGWAYTYFAEIEDLDPTETRKFRLVLPGAPELTKAVVNIQENAQGTHRLYEPGFENISLPLVLSFKFGKTSGGCEFSIGLQVVGWAQEGGDPCLPVAVSWVECSSDSEPKIISVKLSGKNLTGSIPSELTKLTSLEQLWLDGNALTGPIPDFTGCPNLKIIHLENNQLSGDLPSSLADLPNLSQLYVQNNLLTGEVSSGLLNKNIVLNYTGNAGLNKGSNGGRRNRNIIIGVVIGASALFLGFLTSCLLLRKRKKYSKTEPKRGMPVTTNAATEAAQSFTLSELRNATKNFENKVGSGGYGTVYYGKLNDGREIAVKILENNNVYQGKKEFANEVSLLSRIHHRNLVQFLGFCQEEGKDILVYEFMHNGTLKEHLYGPLARERGIKWLKRLEIAEESAKGIEYLHTGCVPSIIHRDLKTSNILLDKNMRAKVSDFGLSKLAIDGTSHVSSIVRGTVGYLDPEYYISNRLTDKTDIYSFGVILLELISGQEAISNVNFGINCRNIVQWAKMHIENGDIQGIIDPALGNEYDIQSMWKIAEKALMCVQPHGNMRPSMSEVIKEIQDAILIEKGVETAAARERSSGEVSRHSILNMGSLDLMANGQDLSIDESFTRPGAR
ncbi:putative protein kinase RLK-Pelle-LRR-I-1 family [Helianthus annuus]|nr:putative protein kinase RLK-Pelle-LRR-I-1 family [Helianthus annuus]